MINNTVYDYESVKLTLPSGIITTGTDISYSQKKDIDVVNDMRGVPRGYVRKAFEGDFSLTMSLSEYEKLSASAGVRGILGMDPIPVVVNYATMGMPVITDMLVVKITEIPREIKEGNEILMSIKGKQTAIPKLGGKAVYAPIS